MDRMSHSKGIRARTVMRNPARAYLLNTNTPALSGSQPVSSE
jgi:hypothetical protein